MNDIKIYFITSPIESKIDQNLLKITKKLTYQLNFKNYKVSLTEFTTSKFKTTYVVLKRFIVFKCFIVGNA